MNAKLNKRERKAQQLLAHYTTCEALGRYLGMTKPDGKKISVALFKIERESRTVTTAYCNGEKAVYRFPICDPIEFDPNAVRSSRGTWENFVIIAKMAIETVLQSKVPGLFINGDARGYALKIDNENPEGLALIRAVGLYTDLGGYGILSPEIDGN